MCVCVYVYIYIYIYIKHNISYIIYICMKTEKGQKRQKSRYTDKKL